MKLDSPVKLLVCEWLFVYLNYNASLLASRARLHILLNVLLNVSLSTYSGSVLARIDAPVDWLPRALARKILQSVVSVRFVSTLSFEPTDLWPLFFCTCKGHDHSSPTLTPATEIQGHRSRSSIYVWNLLNSLFCCCRLHSCICVFVCAEWFYLMFCLEFRPTISEIQHCRILQYYKTYLLTYLLTIS